MVNNIDLTPFFTITGDVENGGVVIRGKDVQGKYIHLTEDQVVKIWDTMGNRMIMVQQKVTKKEEAEPDHD